MVLINNINLSPNLNSMGNFDFRNVGIARVIRFCKKCKGV